jgi:hypothetical protein
MPVEKAGCGHGSVGTAAQLESEDDDQENRMRTPAMKDEPLLATVTGEHFQPVRLHYQVLDHDGLMRAFQKLRCLEHDPARKRWVWLYDHEAKKLQFKQSYRQLPKPLHPIVIGSFFPRGKDHLLLDLRSCERALLAIPFFDKHLPRSVARVTEAEVVNSLFPATGNEQLTPDHLFDAQVSTSSDPEAEVRGLIERVSDVQDPQERLTSALEELETRARRPPPEIERIPVHYYEDGIEGFQLALRMRQIVALIEVSHQGA